jgi:hypothetical protein
MRRCLISASAFFVVAALLQFSGQQQLAGAPVPKDFKFDPTKNCAQCKTCLEVNHVLYRTVIPPIGNPGNPFGLPPGPVTVYHKYGYRDGMNFTTGLIGLDGSSFTPDNFIHHNPANRCLPKLTNMLGVTRTRYLNGATGCVLPANPGDAYWQQAMYSDSTGDPDSDTLQMSYECSN